MQVTEMECTPNDCGEPTPRRFALGTRSVRVGEIIDIWPGSEVRYVKLRGDDGACYILRQDLLGHRWELVMFDRTGTIG